MTGDHADEASAVPDNERTRSPNPLIGLWSKRNTPSGEFTEVKQSGDVFKGVRRDN